MLKQRSLHQVKGKYVYGWNVWVWRNAGGIPPSHQCFHLHFHTLFSLFDKMNAKTLKVQPWILTCLNSVTFAVSSTCCLFICNTLFVLWKLVFSFSLLFSPVFSLSVHNNSSRTFCRVSHSDFYATAVAAGEEGGMYLPVLSGRMCVWWGYVFNFHFNRSLSYRNKQSQRMGCTVCSTKSVKYLG